MITSDNEKSIIEKRRTWDDLCETHEKIPYDTPTVYEYVTVDHVIP